MVEEKEMKWEAGKNTHENVIYACFGGLSNTGIIAAKASMEAEKELGLQKVAIGCLGGLPTNVGCPMECSRKIVEKAGFSEAKSIMLVRDIGMKKKHLHEDIGGDLKAVMDYISGDDVRKAKDLIIERINED